MEIRGPEVAVKAIDQEDNIMKTASIVAAVLAGTLFAMASPAMTADITMHMRKATPMASQPSAAQPRQPETMRRVPHRRAQPPVPQRPSIRRALPPGGNQQTLHPEIFEHLPGSLTPSLIWLKSIHVEPHGTYARFHIETFVPVKMLILVGRYGANSDGTFAAGDLVSTSLFPTGYVSEAHLGVLGLTPDSRLYFSIIAKRQNGKEEVYIGSLFETLRRQVEVTFKSIHMIDDADNWPKASCECHFGFQIVPPPGYQATATHHQNVSSGETISGLNKVLTVITGDSHIRIYAMGIDADPNFGQLSTGGTYPIPACPYDDGDCGVGYLIESIETESWEWQDEEFTQPFTIQVRGDILEFDVSGTMEVSFVP